MQLPTIDQLCKLNHKLCLNWLEIKIFTDSLFASRAIHLPTEIPWEIHDIIGSFCLILLLGIVFASQENVNSVVHRLARIGKSLEHEVLFILDQDQLTDFSNTHFWVVMKVSLSTKEWGKKKLEPWQ